MDIKKSEKKNLSRTYRQSTTNAKKNISNYNNNNENNMTEICSKKNNSQILTKETLKNKSLNTANKYKVLSKKNLYKFFNNSKTDLPLYNINNIINKRQSYQIPKTKNSNLITHKRLTLKKTFKKNKKENNNNNNNTYNRQMTSRKDNKKNQSEIKDRKNEKKRMSYISGNKKIKNENDVNLRRTQIPHNNKKIIFENLNIDDNIKEIKDENEISNKVLRHNTTVFTFEKNNFLFDENKKEINNNEHDLDKFFRQNNNSSINNINNNSELFRFSNISKINNNDLFYLNNNHIYNNFPDNKNSNYFLNPKIETIEGNESHELFEFDDKLLEESICNEEKQKEKINKNEQIVSMPCLNCNKLININEMDEHSNKCYKMKKNIDINESDKNTQLNIIENKLKNILEYLNKNDTNKNPEELIQKLKSIIEEILSTKEINSFSIENLSNIGNKINNLMEKNLNDANYFTLLSRVKILLEEKIKFFSENLKKGIGPISQNKNLGENSIEENISESETMEFFDLKKMEKILDEKELNNQNLDKIINEAKNKRLFLMEVLKVKFQKIKENKNEDLILPEMIWKEALKKNIERNNWTQFIFNELHNPNKYLKMIQKKNNTYQKKK